MRNRCSFLAHTNVQFEDQDTRFPPIHGRGVGRGIGGMGLYIMWYGSLHYDVMYSTDIMPRVVEYCAAIRLS